jgi:transcriptional regulator with XRE-family HTH domain
MSRLTTNKINLRLKDFRKKFALKQADVAAILDLNKQMVCYWEKGTHTPLLAHLIKLAEKYHIAFDYWIVDDDDKALALLDGNRGEALPGPAADHEFIILDQKHISIPYMETEVITATAAILTSCKNGALLYFITGNAGIGKSVALKRCLRDDHEALLITIPSAGADIGKIQDLIFRELLPEAVSPASVLAGLPKNRKLLVIDNAHWISEDAFNIMVSKLYGRMGLTLCGENSIVKKFTAESISVPFGCEIERLFLADQDIKNIAMCIFRELSEDVYAAIRMRGYDSYFKLAQLKNTCDKIMKDGEKNELAINTFYLADFYLMRRLRL